MKRLLRIGIASLLLLASGAGASAQLFDVSFALSQVGTGKRVIAFRAGFKAATILTLREFPAGWVVSVTNDQWGNAEVEGSFQGHGAAAIDPDFFVGLITVEKRELFDLKFSAEASFEVTKDFAETREIVLRGADIVLRPR